LRHEFALRSTLFWQIDSQPPPSASSLLRVNQVFLRLSVPI
jgi:hypothetical protein